MKFKEERIRADRIYTFTNSKSEYDLLPIGANYVGQIVFKNLNTNNTLNMFPKEFFELLNSDSFIGQTKRVPFFRYSKELRDKSPVYAIARGRVDHIVTDSLKYCNYFIQGLQDSVYREFKYYSDAIEFLQDFEEKLELQKFVESDLPENEQELLSAFRTLDAYEKESILIQVNALAREKSLIKK